jgi:rhodanese-related sulfurtransferase/rubrerythrin
MSFINPKGGISEWPAETLREYFQHHHPDDYQLVDVRQFQEYGKEHLPGAIWIPADELPLRMDTLDAAKTTIVYCSHGSLSRAAAQVLVSSGFREVHALEGGLHAWRFGSATGLPAQIVAPLAEAGSAQEQAILAWRVEENTRRFYEELADTLDEPQVAGLFAELAAAESNHKATLRAIWEALSGRLSGDDFPAEESSDSERLEGGMCLNKALDWAANSTTARILDFAMALELSAYDQYLYLQRSSEDPDSKRLFEVLAGEERHHLKEIGKSLGKLRE